MGGTPMVAPMAPQAAPDEDYTVSECMVFHRKSNDSGVEVLEVSGNFGSAIAGRRQAPLPHRTPYTISLK